MVSKTKDAPFILWTADSLTRVFEDSRPEYESSTIKLKAAQNEYESAQLVITAKRDLTSLKAYAVDLKDDKGKTSSES